MLNLVAAFEAQMVYAYIHRVAEHARPCEVPHSWFSTVQDLVTK